MFIEIHKVYLTPYIILYIQHNQILYNQDQLV